MRRADTSRRWCAVLTLALLAGACTTAQSNKAATYDVQPKRVLVVGSLPSYPNLRATEVGSRLVAALGTCGVTAESHSAAPVASLTVIDDAGEAAMFRAQADEVARFQPDAMLAVVQSQGNIKLFTGALQSAIYTLALHDVASQKTVWKAEVRLMTEGGIFNVVGSPAASLASAIVDRLSQDRIVGACATKR